MNKGLNKLYKLHYPGLTQELFQLNEKILEKLERATNPLLLSVDENYEKAHLKIMFFGQETNKWFGEQNEGVFLGEIKPLINLYIEFYLNNRCYKYGGHFWNGINRFKKLLKDQIPSRSIELLWNNVVKIGKCGKGFPYSINYVTNKYFNVIPEEIRITQPDIIIFFSGPNYDNEIKKILGPYDSISMGSFPKRHLCKLKFKSYPLAFRTYHPNFLWRNNIDKYLNAIISEIKHSK